MKIFEKESDVFRILSEAVSEGIIVVNKSQKIVATNGATNKMFGYPEGALIGKPLNTLIPKEYRQSHPELFKQFMKNSGKRKMGEGRDLYGVKKCGTPFPVEVGLNPFVIYENVYVMALVFDVTASKNYTEQLEQKVVERTKQLNEALVIEKELNELKTKFLSLVSHEFKTPLSNILTSVTLASKYTEEEQRENREKHHTIIKNKVKYLNNILNDFLSIERLDSGKENYNFSTFPLSKVLDEVIYNAKLFLKEGQKLDYPHNVEEYTIEFEEKTLEIVLSNLVNNAIKYSPENTVVSIKISKGDEKIIFEISDQGIGIPKEEQKFIFERYFRAGNAILTQGTGIGLNIVKTHLENLGGSIRFKSQENIGSTFTIHIPTLIKQE